MTEAYPAKYYCGVMSTSLEYLLEKFPDHRSKIIVLYNTDEDFRMLCDDYFTAVQGLEKYREKGLKNKDNENEYSQIYVELEKEIIKLLEAGRN